MLVGPPSGDARRIGSRDSGVYYLAFGRPARRARGARSRRPDVADGSQIVSERVGGPKLTIGRRPIARRERYGSCLVRLATPDALPAATCRSSRRRYVDAGGVRYRQESFADADPGDAARSSASSGVVVDPRFGQRPAPGTLRLTPSVSGLRRVGDRLRRGKRTPPRSSAPARRFIGSVARVRDGREPLDRLRGVAARAAPTEPT